jgi:hypothetical protein
MHPLALIVATFHPLMLVVQHELTRLQNCLGLCCYSYLNWVVLTSEADSHSGWSHSLNQFFDFLNGIDANRCKYALIKMGRLLLAIVMTTIHCPPSSKQEELFAVVNFAVLKQEPGFVSYKGDRNNHTTGIVVMSQSLYVAS